MNKNVLFIVLLMLGISLSAQDVRYYKLVSTKIDGITSKNVSGGQFITFTGNLCFESKKNGVGVNHGTLKRNDSYSNSQYTIYQGSSYWGETTTFKFNADKSMLNVVLDNGDIFVYKRATPPAGQTTCSLIRERGSDGGGTDAGYTPIPNPIPQYPQQQNPQQQQYEQLQPKSQPVKCRVCNGTGRIEKMLAGSDGGNRKYCNECRQLRSTHHYHGTCETCRGNGYL